MSLLSTLVLKVFKAIGLLASAVAVMAQTPQALEHAQGLLAHGQTAEAGRTLDAFLAQHPGNADAWTLLGVANAATGVCPRRPRNASAKPLSLDPHLTAAQTNLGHLLLDEHRPAEALPYIAEALQHDRANSRLRDMLVSAAEGTALKQRAGGDRDGALATLLSAKAEATHSFPLLLDLSILEDELPFAS